MAEERTIAFKTLGCRLNLYETDSLASEFANSGYKIVDFNERADVYVVNTCTVTNQSDHKSRNLISQAARKNKDAIVLVTGCMANSDKEELEKNGNISYVVENAQKSSVFPIVDAHFKGELVQASSFDKDLFGFKLADKGFHTRSMIKIQDGCNSFCSYCIIPKVRGRETSRPVGEILENIRQVIANGVKEVVLTGVNISRYRYNEYTFEDLIEAILNLEGDFRVRISSIEPDNLTSKFFDLFLHPKLTPHLHLCLQSGSERILKAMRRMYNLSEYYYIAAELRKRVSDFNLTTDIIVGFPGETEEDFNDTLKVIKDINFSHVHTFKFSLRQGTMAEKLPNHISDAIKTERSKAVRDLAEGLRRKYVNSFVGKEQRVLIEKITDEYVQGYGEYYLPCKIYGADTIKNSFISTVPGQLHDGTLVTH